MIDRLCSKGLQSFAILHHSRNNENIIPKQLKRESEENKKNLSLKPVFLFVESSFISIETREESFFTIFAELIVRFAESKIIYYCANVVAMKNIFCGNKQKKFPWSCPLDWFRVLFQFFKEGIINYKRPRLFIFLSILWLKAEFMWMLINFPRETWIKDAKTSRSVVLSSSDVSRFPIEFKWISATLTQL